MSTALVVVHGPGEQRRAYAVDLPADPQRPAILAASAARLEAERIEAEPMTLSQDAAGWVVEYTVDGS